MNEFECPKCKTVYFERQECDWCPGEYATIPIKLGVPGFTGTGKAFDEKPCTICQGSGQIPVADGHHGHYGHIEECPQCAIIRTNGAGEKFGCR